jgi:hypothetical protein
MKNYLVRFWVSGIFLTHKIIEAKSKRGAETKARKETGYLSKEYTTTVEKV